MLQVSKMKCMNCRVRSKCFIANSSPSTFRRLNDVVEEKTLEKSGDFLCRIGEDFKYLYIVKTGSFKIYHRQKEHLDVVGFAFPGEFIGFDGVGEDYYPYNISAFERSLVCQIPLVSFKNILASSADLNLQLLNVMGLKIKNERRRVKMLLNKSAEQKIAGYLYELFHSVINDGMNNRVIGFKIFQQDVANFLGVSPETMSRTLTKFYEQGMVHWRNQEINILNEQKLLEIL